MTDQQPDTDPASLGPVRDTAADRRSIPNLHEIAQAAADKYGECRRPIPMYTYDRDTGDTKYVGAPCKSTLESVCPSCAAKARSLRMQQAHEGWHIETEPVDIKRDPTQHQLELVETRASLMTNYQEAKASGDQDMMDGIREVVSDVDADLRETGVRGRLPALDPEPKSERKRSTRRRQDVPDLPRKKIDKATIGRQYAGKYRPSMFITLTLDSYGKINRDGATNADGKPCSDGSAADPDSYDYLDAPPGHRVLAPAAVRPGSYTTTAARSGRATFILRHVDSTEGARAPHFSHGCARNRPRALILQIGASATYLQVWWPHLHPDNEQYTDGTMPVWDYTAGDSSDPDIREPLPT